MRGRAACIFMMQQSEFPKANTTASRCKDKCRGKNHKQVLVQLKACNCKDKGRGQKQGPVKPKSQLQRQGQSPSQRQVPVKPKAPKCKTQGRDRSKDTGQPRYKSGSP